MSNVTDEKPLEQRRPHLRIIKTTPADGFIGEDGYTPENRADALLMGGAAALEHFYPIVRAAARILVDFETRGPALREGRDGAFGPRTPIGELAMAMHRAGLTWSYKNIIYVEMLEEQDVAPVDFAVR